MKTLADAPRTTEPARGQRLAVSIVLAMLAASVLCLALAPALMPDSYSIVEHSISESAGQLVEDAWLARTGLLLLGFAVLVSASLCAHRWGSIGQWVHRAYGASIIAVATFAHMPSENVPYDETEDLLHSVASFAVGLSFVLGVVVVSLRRQRDARVARVFDAVAILASVVIPLVMLNVTGIAGLVQRIMFGIAFVWYGLEVTRTGRTAAHLGRVGSVPTEHSYRSGGVMGR